MRLLELLLVVDAQMADVRVDVVVQVDVDDELDS